MDEPRADQDGHASDVWQDVTAGFVDLGTRLRTYFASVPDESADEEMQDAWSEFTTAAQRLGRSVTSAFQDEDVQDSVKQAFGTLVDAVGTTVRDASDRFNLDSDEADDEQDSSDESDQESTES